MSFMPRMLFCTASAPLRADSSERRATLGGLQGALGGVGHRLRHAFGGGAGFLDLLRLAIGGGKQFG
jgi:predicted lipid-binding transport protein (Tim44 family)